jgi:anti-sigma B factor antagonist
MADETGGSHQPVAGVERQNGAVVVRLVGELDLYNAPAVRQSLLALCDERPARLIVDLEQVVFIDSTALGVLIEARSRLSDGQSFVLAAPTPDTHRALRISGLDRHLVVHESVSAAVSATPD